MTSADVLHVIAADHLKLNFPMAWSAATLAWGFIEFQDVSPCPIFCILHRQVGLFTLICCDEVMPGLHSGRMAEGVVWQTLYHVDSAPSSVLIANQLCLQS